MHFIIYKTTNLINNKYYIGAHKTANLQDGYKGSGTALKCAFAEHGRHNFIRETLEVCDTEESMYTREAAIVTAAVVADRNTYNISTGGKGGPGTPKSEEHKQKIRDSHLHKSNIGAGRKPAPFSSELIDLCDTYGKRKAAEILDISVQACVHRYYRLKNKRV